MPYELTKDPFYQKKTVFATWIMIWDASTETHWWKASDTEGVKVLVNGKMQSINWNDKAHIQFYVNEIKNAGIDLIIVDFTNGFAWKWQALMVQKLCLENGMKFAIALNPQMGNMAESQCKMVWDDYAAPEAPFSSAYFYKDGNPLVVFYTTRAGYNNSMAEQTEYRVKFTGVWASGEDGDKDKWGWQLEPQKGVIPSDDAMYVTSSIDFDSPYAVTDDKWRHSLAWLDYNFGLAVKNDPKNIIVGSYDDVHERNLWMKADTSGAVRGRQLRDIYGDISTDAYYDRVCSWIRDGKPETVPGGLIPDGGYRVASSGGSVLGVEENRTIGSPAVLTENDGGIGSIIWFYHLGYNEYRIIKLNAGLSFEDGGSGVYQNWDDNISAQRWIAQKDGVGRFRFINKATGNALDFSGDRILTSKPDSASSTQVWRLDSIG